MAYTFRTPIATRITAVMTARIVGHVNAFLRLSNELRRQAISGPTPVRKSRNRPIGMLTRLKYGPSTEIFSPVTASEITGNSVPHRIEKQLASRMRLLNRKLDSRDNTLSSCDSLFKYSSLLRIRYTTMAIPKERKMVK